MREEYEAKLYDQFRVLDLKKKELEIEKEEREKDERSFKEEKTGM